MAVAMTMSVAGQHDGNGYSAMPYGAAPLQSKRWGTNPNNLRYIKTCHKIGKDQLGQGFDSRRLKGLQKKNRLKPKNVFTKRRSVPRTVPRAPFNDSSFLMRVRRSGGLDSVVSPAPTCVLLSPVACTSYSLSPFEDFVDHEDYGYGSMTGLIHLRPTDDEDRSSGSSTVDNNFDDNHMFVEQPSVLSADAAEHVEQRLDRVCGRFELTRPSTKRLDQAHMEERVARQDAYIEHLEDENLVLKERLFLIEKEVHELRQRLQGGQSCNIDESDDNQDCLDS